MAVQKLSKLRARKILILDSSGNNPVLAFRIDTKSLKSRRNVKP